MPLLGGKDFLGEKMVEVGGMQTTREDLGRHEASIEHVISLFCIRMVKPLAPSPGPVELMESHPWNDLK